MKLKALVTAEVVREKLQERFAEQIEFAYDGYYLDHEVMPHAELVEKVKGYDILICEYDTVSKDVIDEAFAAYEEEFGVSAADTQDALIRKLIMKRCPQGVDGLDYEAKQKLLAYMYGRGFSVSDTERVIHLLKSGDI